jgi:hypothetical protein
VFGTTFFTGGAGVEGISSTGPGVYGACENPDPNSPKRFGGYFEGGIRVVNGPKNFAIDHPLDPQNKYLVHTCVESSEMKNIYDGDARLDKDGAAWVELPEWFEALNGDFRYQLTPIGGSAPNLHIAEEISQNRFKIAGGTEGMKYPAMDRHVEREPETLHVDQNRRRNPQFPRKISGAYFGRGTLGPF